MKEDSESITPTQEQGFTDDSNETTPKPGRPKGSRNTLTLLQQAAVTGVMTEVLENFDRIVKKTIQLAEEGDTVCLKILWDRVIPARKAVEHISNPASGGVTIVVRGIDSINHNTITDGEYSEVEDNGRQ